MKQYTRFEAIIANALVAGKIDREEADYIFGQPVDINAADEVAEETTEIEGSKP